MDRAKVPVVVLTVALVAGLILAGAVYYFYHQEHVKNISLQEQIEDLNTKQRIIENKLDESKKKITGLQEELTAAKAQIDSLSAQLQEEKGAREQANKQLDQLKADLELQKDLRMDLETKLSKVQVEARATKDALDRTEKQKKELESKLNDLEAKNQNVELGKIVVNTESGKAAKQPDKKKEKGGFLFFKKKPADPALTKAPTSSAVQQAVVQPGLPVLEGKVAVVNNEYSFAVISLGTREGVKTGDIFSVYHNGKYVGDVKAEKVHDSLTAANFADPALKDKIAEGDKVTLRGR
jgi:predicted RNase H-like nuclease (RuvC/YqgF family)